MTREIRFRAWNGREKKMSKSFDLDQYAADVDSEYGWGYLPDLSDATTSLMQFTGLKDKNGVEIYEGDIVKVRTVRVSGSYSSWYQKKNINHKYVEIDCYVFWSEQDLGWRLRPCNKEKIEALEDPQKLERIKQHVHVPYKLTDRGCCANGEVIGNIYENPELLKNP